MLVRSCGALHQLLGSTNKCERKTDAELIGDFSLNVANVAGLCEFKGMLVASTHIPKVTCCLTCFACICLLRPLWPLWHWLDGCARCTGLFVPKNPREWNFRFDIWIGLRLQIQGLFVFSSDCPSQNQTRNAQTLHSSIIKPLQWGSDCGLFFRHWLRSFDTKPRFERFANLPIGQETGARASRQVGGAVEQSGSRIKTCKGCLLTTVVHYDDDRYHHWWLY